VAGGTALRIVKVVCGQLHALAALSPGKESVGTHWIGGWMGHRAGLDTVEKRKISHHCFSLQFIINSASVNIF